MESHQPYSVASTPSPRAPLVKRWLCADTKPGATKAPKPKISGHYRVGRKLTAKAGTWGPGSVHLAYRWTRDGKDIAKATKKTYVLKKADKRHRIAVTVTATETGYSRSVKKSASHRIPS